MRRIHYLSTDGVIRWFTPDPGPHSAEQIATFGDASVWLHTFANGAHEGYASPVLLRGHCPAVELPLCVALALLGPERLDFSEWGGFDPRGGLR